MQTNRRFLGPTVATLALAVGFSGAAQTVPTRPHAHSSAAKTTKSAPRALAPLSEEEKATQVLSRFTFGPRPGEIADVTRTGWESWFERQLNPAAIPDPGLEKRLAQYPSLAMTPQQIAVNFPDGQNIRKVAEGKLPVPDDPMLAGAYEVMVLRYSRKQAEDKAAAAASASPGVPSTSASPAASAPPVTPAGAAGKTPAAGAAPEASTPAAASTDQQKAEQKQQDQKQAAMLADQVLGYPKNLRMQAIMKLPAEQRLILAGNVADPQKALLQNDFSPREKELFALMGSGYGGNGVAGNELVQAKLLRAILSERQLQEVMTDFWFNHFNVDLSKSGDEINYLSSYERDAIRPHALGKFRDLLLGTAQHPAMLIYLDNWLSIGPDSQAAGRPRPNQKNQGQKGLNENYGREVMELHTVSVNGGYSQADVTNLAKILTGWTVDQPQMGGGFLFEPKRHEPGTKQWFGQKIEENGYQEGVNALTWLARQPQTAHFISLKLAQRFVADDPPAALVDRMAAAYLSTDGDIKEVLRAMVHSPEFFSRANYRNKVKMPLEFVASAFRATSTDPTNPQALVGVLKNMDEPLYRCQPPTGYAATADHWMNSAALVDRLNFSLQLTGSKVGGIRFDGPRLLAAGLLDHSGEASVPSARSVALHSADGTESGQDEALRLMEEQLIAGQVSDRTNAVIKQELAAAQPPQQQASDPAQTLNSMAAMILGSPEFQMH